MPDCMQIIGGHHSLYLALAVVHIWEMLLIKGNVLVCASVSGCFFVTM